MRIVDEKGKLFGKISIIDLCVVLVILLALAALVFKNASLKKTEKSDVEITYTVKVRGVREQTLNQLQNSKNTEAFTGKDKESLGTITDVVSDEAYDFVVDKNGNYLEVPLPDRYDVKVTFTTIGTDNENGIYTQGGKQLFMGENITIATNNFETSGEVLSIEVAK